MNFHIVIIEDEEDILELEEYHLSKAGYEVTGFLSTKNVEQFLQEEYVHLLIVDRNLPGAEGSEFVQYLREQGYDMPVIFVSAKDEDTEVEEGFERGGDDYLRKPFNIKELVFRVNSLLKRTNTNPDMLKYKDIIVDLDKRVVYVGQEIVKVSKLEFELLSFMIKNRDRVMERYELIEEVWQDISLDEKTVNVTLNRLIKKLDPKKEKNYIEPVRGIGYKLC